METITMFPVYPAKLGSENTELACPDNNATDLSSQKDEAIPDPQEPRQKKILHKGDNEPEGRGRKKTKVNHGSGNGDKQQKQQMATFSTSTTTTVTTTKTTIKQAGRLYSTLGNDMAERLINLEMKSSSAEIVTKLCTARTAVEIATNPAKLYKEGSPCSKGDNSSTDDGYSSNAQGLQDNGAATAPSPDPVKTETTVLRPVSARRHSKSPRGSVGHTFTLDDFSALDALSMLVERYGRVAHMGVLDPSYCFYLSTTRDAALYYKVKDRIAIIGGDPLCHPDHYESFLEEFRCFRKKNGWGIALMGASDGFVEYAKSQKWVTMRFGRERVLNPLTNPVLLETAGKRIVKQCKQLLDPKRGGIEVKTYIPALGRDSLLEQQLIGVYDAWRDDRNSSGRQQAYMTVFDPFALPHLMMYIYTVDVRAVAPQANGFAALRKIGANNGYHIDPYCALPDAPRGITDLLVFSAMSLLKMAGVTYLSFGFEPSKEVSSITSMSRPIEGITKFCYRRAFQRLPIGGKQAYYDKFYPDESLESGIHIVYPDGRPTLRHSRAALHFANICASDLLRAEAREFLSARRKHAEKKLAENNVAEVH